MKEKSKSLDDRSFQKSVITAILKYYIKIKLPPLKDLSILFMIM